MATITLTYDEKNSIAKKTIDYILSLGVFKVEDKKKKKFKKKLKQALIEKDQILKDIKTGKEKWLTKEELLNEL